MVFIAQPPIFFENKILIASFDEQLELLIKCILLKNMQILNSN